MGSPYGFELVENCVICKLRSDSFFCSLPKSALEAFDRIKYTASYPAGAVLFVEGQSPRGIYMLFKGRVKLSTTSAEGKTLIRRFGLIQPIDWSQGRPDPMTDVAARQKLQCQPVLQIKNGQFTMYQDVPGKPWTCLDTTKDATQPAQHLSFAPGGQG